jgi:hypothetical protein
MLLACLNIGCHYNAHFSSDPAYLPFRYSGFYRRYPIKCTMMDVRVGWKENVGNVCGT